MQKQEPECFLKGFDGETVHYRTFESSPKKPIVLGLHGLNGHSGLYSDLAKVVQNAGLAFWMMDLRGHGYSGKRGFASGWEALIADFLSFYHHAQNQNQVVGVFGHSFGGLLSFYLANALGQSAPPLFLSSPCFKLKNNPSWKRLMVDLTPQGVASIIKIPLGIKPSSATDSPSAQASHKEDPLRPGWVSLRYGRSFLESVDHRRVFSIAKSFESQVHIVAAGRDELVETSFTKRVCDDAFPKNLIHLTIEPDAAHEVFFSEMEKRQSPMKVFSQWLREIQ
jgi:lysophospholipase